MIFSDRDNQRVRILISKGLRADMLLEMSNAQQSGPQRADLNLHANLPAIYHAQCSFTAWVHAASLASNHPLYNAFNTVSKELCYCKSSVQCAQGMYFSIILQAGGSLCSPPAAPNSIIFYPYLHTWYVQCCKQGCERASEASLPACIYRTFAKKGPWVVHLTLDLDWGMGRYSKYHCRS